MDDTIHPRAEEYWAQVHEDHTVQPAPWKTMKAEAREAGLWNMFLPGDHGAGLTNLEYAPLAEIMGRAICGRPRCSTATPPTPAIWKCSICTATRPSRHQWLKPLMAGEIRSAFLMTEPEVASSDATNIQTSIVRDGDEYVINGRKWWSTNMGHPNVADRHRHGQDRHFGRHPRAAVADPGARRTRPASASSGCCPCSAMTSARSATPRSCSTTSACRSTNLIAGEGRGFEIAQGRLGPGRIHHCMRVIGAAERRWS
jgi:acyl-CoA dehydrogenase